MNLTYPDIGAPLAGGANKYTFSPNGTGGANYFNNGKPITREQFAVGSGLSPGQIEYHYAQPAQSAASPTQNAPATDYAALYAAAAGGAAAAPRPVNLDFAGIQARARQQAEGSVNPLYTQKLNDFLANQATQKARADADKATNDKLIQEGLQNLVSQNELTGQRTATDVANNLNALGSQEQFYQQQEGQAFDQARTGLQQGIAQSGLTGSGLGAQREQQAISQRNAQSGQQVQSFNIQKQAQQTLKTRTFQDLAKSTELGTKQAGTQKEQNQLNLNRFIEDQATQLDQERKNQEIQKQADIQAAQGRYAKEQFVNALQGIGNQGTRLATQQAYAGLF